MIRTVCMVDAGAFRSRSYAGSCISPWVLGEGQPPRRTLVMSSVVLYYIRLPVLIFCFSAAMHVIVDAFLHLFFFNCGRVMVVLSHGRYVSKDISDVYPGN
jgi:hypothetical protein